METTGKDFAKRLRDLEGARWNSRESSRFWVRVMLLVFLFFSALWAALWLHTNNHLSLTPLV